jgi:hypothetical protein
MFIESLAHMSLHYIHGGVLTISRPQLPTKPDQPNLYVAIWLVGLQWTSQGHN